MLSAGVRARIRVQALNADTRCMSVMTAPEATSSRALACASVIIPAHNEARVIRRCLEALFTGLGEHRLEVIVVCNGCDDDTAAQARAAGHDVLVLEIEAASKTAALRLGDATATVFPRLYLDGDVALPGASAVAVARRLAAGAIAARPPIRYDSSRSSGPVRSYYRARAEMPAVMRSLWGAGIYGLSAAGRARFDSFPDLVADDLWLDRQFEADEIEIVDCAPVIVAVPRASRDLIHMLRRTYRGKAEHSPARGHDERARSVTNGAVRDLRALARSGPRAARDAVTYAAFAAGARLAMAAAGAARPGGVSWERDDSSRGA